MRTPPYKLEVTVTSSGPDATGGDVLYQEITVREYSDDPALHIQKNMTLAQGIMGAFGSMVEQAKKDLAAKK